MRDLFNTIQFICIAYAVCVYWPFFLILAIVCGWIYCIYLMINPIVKAVQKHLVSLRRSKASSKAPKSGLVPTTTDIDYTWRCK